MTNTPDCLTAGGAELGPLLLHIDQVALKLGLSRYQVRGLIKAGRLPLAPDLPRMYVPAAAVDAYVDSIGAA